MKPLFLSLLVLLSACTECPRCPTPEPAPVVTLHPEPVTLPQDAGRAPKAEPSAPQVEWQPVDPMTLAGKWRAVDGRPLPTFELVIAEPGSKTPMNFDIRAGKPAHIGCGLYPATGTSYCKWVFAIADEPKAKSEELYALFVSKGDVISVELYDSSKGLLFAGQFVREAAK